MKRLPGGPAASENGRAVSDVLSYVLMFSVLIISVGLVSTIGIQQLEEMRSQEQLNNAERAFRLMELNLDELQQGQAIVRSSEIDLHSGSIHANVDDLESGQANVTIHRDSSSDITQTITLNDIQYELDDKVVAYESGGVFYSDQNSNDVLEDGPEVICSEDRAVVSLVRLEGAAGNQLLTGGTVRVTAQVNSSRLIYPQERTGAGSVNASTGVTVEFDSRYDGAWDVFFQDIAEGWTKPDPTNPRYRCDGDGDSDMQVYVRLTRINVSLQR